MRVLAACSLGGAGHLRPLLPLLDAASGQRYETLVVGPPALRDMVAATGQAFAPGAEPPEAAVAPIRERLPVVPAREASVLGNRELFGRLAATAMLPAMERVLTDWRPDIVLRDPCEYASAVVAPSHGVPTVQVAIGLADVEWGSIAVAAPALDEHRPGLADELRRSPYVTRFPASVDPSRFADTRRVREPGRPAPRPLPDWWGGARSPLVYVSFGTVLGRMSVGATAYRTVVDAVAALDARVLLTVGRRFDASLLGAVPDHVHVEAWVDQSEVLGEADVVVCHGGSGTAFGAVAAGVPLVIVPLFADHHANGEALTAAGVAVVVDTGGDGDGRRQPLGRDDAPRIAAAIDRVRGDSTYRDNARRVAAEMAAAPAADTLLASFEA